jgi:GGDEF domain-containing protein
LIAGAQEQGLAVSWLRKSSNLRDKVNDFYGNQTEDQVLVEISKVLNKQLQHPICWAGMAGEECLAVFFGTRVDSGRRKQ